MPSRPSTPSSPAPRRRRASRLDEAPPENPPLTLEQMRADLLEKVTLLLNSENWPTCGRAACKRHRRCAAGAGLCFIPQPPPSMTPEQEAIFKARLKRMLEQRRAEIAKDGGMRV